MSDEFGDFKQAERQYTDSRRPDVARTFETVGFRVEVAEVPAGRYLFINSDLSATWAPLWFRVTRPTRFQWANELPAYQAEPLFAGFERTVDVPPGYRVEWISNAATGLTLCPLVLFPEDHKMGVK